MKQKRRKYIFVIGGVMSGVGKGIATSSIGTLLQAYGFETNLVKVDPYLNVDAGTMNPTEHGEVFVMNSGLETDQDMGNYERFLNRDLTHDDYMTSGMVYYDVLRKERALGYKGRCIEAIPDIRDEIVRRYEKAAERSDCEITVVEIGGTVGDYQNVMFIEAARVLKLRHPDDVKFILVTFLPIPSKIGEMKTRPTQNAVRQLNSYGVQPDFIIARSSIPLDHKRKEKIALSCNVYSDHVISAPDIDSIYDVPINFEKDKMAELLLKSLKLRPKPKKEGLGGWRKFVESVKKAKSDSAQKVKIAVVGKYFDSGDFVFADAYISVIEAIKFSAYQVGVKPELSWINSKDFESGKLKISMLKDFDGVLVPGGFGETGVEGIISAISFARKNKIPYFGLCYGMQLLVVEYARNAAGLKGANTAEIDTKAAHTVIDIMDDQKKKLAEGNYGGSMRLGAYVARLKSETIARDAYESDTAYERHRHRFEVNLVYISKLEKAGLVFSGTSPDGRLMEIAELPRAIHPFFLGTQFHPEFLARPLSPHPLFTEFIKAAAGK